MLTVSDTAYAIATVRAAEANITEGRLFEDPYAAIFAAAGGHAAEGTDLLMAMPFFPEGIRLRTRAIDVHVLAAIESGTRQLVLMGAGFDARALRLEPVVTTSTHAFEIDKAELLEQKQAALARAGVELPSRIQTIATDFGDDFEAPLRAALAERGFDRERPAVFVWEGVIPYLGPDAVARCLRFMADLGAAGTRLVFDYSPISFDPDTARARVLQAGFTHFESVTLETEWRRHWTSAPHPNASFFEVALASK
ncbi:MAG: SAM-dependent methyltransferase [Polyangiaceae bacterium]